MDFPKGSAECRLLTINGQDVFNINGFAEGFKSNIRIQSDNQRFFVCAFSERAIEEEWDKPDQEYNRQIYLNPNINRSTVVLGKLLKAANRHNIPIEARLIGLSLECTVAHRNPSYEHYSKDSELEHNHRELNTSIESLIQTVNSGSKKQLPAKPNGSTGWA